MLCDANFREIYVACGRTDLRKGIDGLSSLVRGQFEMNPFQEGVLFLFCGARRDRIKGLVWEGDGFVLLYKRVENGGIKWPRSRSDMAEIDPSEFRKLLAGMTILEEPSVRRATCSLPA